MNWREQYKKAITFSYDDGNEQDIRLIEILNAYGLKSTFNVNTGLNKENSAWKYRDRLWVHRLSLADCTVLYTGHEIAVHGKKHLNLTECSPEEVHEEIYEDAEAITRIFGTKPVGMAYAYGAHNEVVRNEIKQMGIQYARGTRASHSFSEQTDLLQFQPTCHHDDAILFSLAEKFLTSKPETPQIFYIWGHSYELEGNQNWDLFKRFCEYISGRDDIFYGTNCEVLL